MAKCLVVGANGFIGSSLVDDLVRRGHDVSAFDRFSASAVSYESTDVRRFSGDFMNRADMRKAVEGQEYLFHFLSATTPASAEDDPTVDIRTNIASSVELFQDAVDAGVRKVFFASTGGAIYGDQPFETLNENVTPLPVSPYAIGKLAIEGYLRYFNRKFGLESVSFRISNPYGPRQRAVKRQGVIPIFLHRLTEGLPLVVLGDGSMVRDYIYAEDAVRMIGETVGRPSTHSVYNIGNGAGASLSELLEIIRAVTGIKPTIDARPVPSTYLDRVVLDTTRYTEEFGTLPVDTLESGIRKTWENIRVMPV
ncbi:NAD-dependent epimerase/dehydratase family protein [Glaciibacter superstes]|uniref:NAD-dependent epimerase/dehydratase family protein n=1 Tax=Glaciibacter superstes TaxID=501023 RepID=UPI0003B51B5B|nr:NAD-dependent epimerase/dehydratase family protein [Glaciibacter superstes]